MKLETLIVELEKLRTIYPESTVWIEDCAGNFSDNFDIKVLVTETEEEVTLKMGN